MGPTPCSRSTAATSARCAPSPRASGSGSCPTTSSRHRGAANDGHRPSASAQCVTFAGTRPTLLPERRTKLMTLPSGPIVWQQGGRARRRYTAHERTVSRLSQRWRCMAMTKPPGWPRSTPSQTLQLIPGVAGETAPHVLPAYCRHLGNHRAHAGGSPSLPSCREAPAPQ
jgi:hypothetical protein